MVVVQDDDVPRVAEAASRSAVEAFLGGVTVCGVIGSSTPTICGPVEPLVSVIVATLDEETLLPAALDRLALLPATPR